MKKALIILTLCLMHAAGGQYGSSQSAEVLLRDLASESEKYSGKKITMRLKLKVVDWLFGKAYFYDRKNQDIAFDIALQGEMEEFRSELLSLREGYDFEVTFLYQGVGNIGMIQGELIKVVPVILLKLPEGEEKKNRKF